MSFLRKILLLALAIGAAMAMAETVVIDDKTPSLFFGTRPARANFDYQAWTENERIYTNRFDRDAWDEKAPTPVPDEDGIIHLTRSQAEALLLRWQKPGGYESASHLPILRAILGKRIAEDSPRLVAGALQNVLATARSDYDGLLHAHRKLKEMKLPNGKNPCRTKAEEKALVQAATAYLADQMKKLLPDADPLAGTTLGQWSNLMPLSPLLHQLSDDDRGWYEDQIMEGMVFDAARKELKGVFKSIVASFTEQTVSPFFGDEPEETTRITLVRRGKWVTPYLMSTSPIQGLAEKPNIYGFYSARLPAISEKPGTIRNRAYRFEWTTAGQRHEAEVDLKRLKVREPLVNDEPSPRYEELWRPLKPGGPKTMTGLVVFGSTLADDAPDTVKAYVAHLKDREFEEVGKPVRSDNLKRFIRDQLTSGETSWFEKEAHSDADDTNIFEIDRHSEIRTFRRVRDDGRVEVIRIAYPKEGVGRNRKERAQSEESEMISDIEFGKWMRIRKRRSGKQLIFFNASCWSENKGENEITEARTSVLTEVLTTTVTDYFRNKDDNAMRIVTDGLSDGLNWEQMRKELMKDEDYVRRTADRLIFPDEPEYPRRLFKGAAPIRIRINTHSHRLSPGKDPCGPTWRRISRRKRAA